MIMHAHAVRITKPDALRFEQLRLVGCICCRKSDVLGLYIPGNELHIHHLLKSGKRRGHRFTVPLCKFHHTGVCSRGRTWGEKWLGPSLAYGSKPFRAVYGSDDDLLAYADRLIEFIHY